MCAFKLFWCFLTFLFVPNIVNSDVNEFCDAFTEDCNVENTVKSKYVFYDINPPEGFNLRRDVYMRFAIFANSWLDNDELKHFKLVLPPWSYLYHWKRSEKPEFTPWGRFFDLESLKRFAPIIEMHEFFTEYPLLYPPVKLDNVYILQHFKEMFDSGKFEDKMQIDNCIDDIKTNFYFYDNVTSETIECLSFHGHVGLLSAILENSNATTIMFDHAEVALHNYFGDRNYWRARRSMRFNKELVKIAKDFRVKFLGSDDVTDDVLMPEKWEEEQPRRSAKGGPYIAVHLRRRDFVYARRTETPSLKNAANQIKKLLKQLNLKKVFVATDAPESEFVDLQLFITEQNTNDYEVFKFKPNTSVKSKYKDGGVAIIDQIICSYANFFIGSYESTFSFRIQEEREIIGFPWESTFNRLCGDGEENCKRPSIWKIVY